MNTGFSQTRFCFHSAKLPLGEIGRRYLVRVSVIGLGKIGLPLACQIASSGLDVLGFDISGSAVDSINSGTPPFPNEPGLEDRLRHAIRSGLLKATTNPQEALAGRDVVVVCVPLMLDPTSLAPDFSSLDLACQLVGENAGPNALIIIETTVPVGTTRNRVASKVRSASKTNANFEFAFSPERISSGSALADLRKYPKIVGGESRSATDRAADFYKTFLDFNHRPDLNRPNGVWTVESCESAEMVKLMETTYRDVNIALANEFVQDCLRLGLDFGELREAANSQPYSHIHSAGISVGGHCIPVYPRLYLESGSSSGLIPLARTVNDGMPGIAASLIEKDFGSLKGRRVLIAGVSYRSLVRETAYSGAFALKDELEKRGAEVEAIDPLYSEAELAKLGFPALTETAEIELIVVHTHHPDYESWTSSDFPMCSMIFQGRPGPLRSQLRPHFTVKDLF